MSTSTTATTAAMQGSGTTTTINNNNDANLGLEDFQIPSSQLFSVLNSKDDPLQVLKNDLMDALNKEVKSLDEDSWMFDGPRSRINLISKPGTSFSMKNRQAANQWNFGLPK